MPLGCQEESSPYPKPSGQQLDRFDYGHGLPCGKAFAILQLWPNPIYLSSRFNCVYLPLAMVCGAATSLWLRLDLLGILLSCIHHS